MKRLEQALNDYLCIRRGLGFQLQEEESRLRNFVAFVQAERASYITFYLGSAFRHHPTLRSLV